jgi:putative tryptophan/tyrosine transport system substrate-binding protein
MIERREFIIGLGSVAAWPVVAQVQQATMPVIGFLHPASPDLVADRLRAFRLGLAETGYTEGQNVGIEYRWAENQDYRLPALAAELVVRRVVVIFAGGSVPALTAKAATTTIPIIFSIGEDPVQAGLVASLNRPGGNVTGASNLTVEVVAKRLELLHKLVPTAPILAALVNPANPNAATLSMGCSSMCCMRATNATSIRSSQPWSNCRQVGWLSLAIRSSPAILNSSPH